tara:strand:+ start:1874 stop:3316 length:1443 start_codon:yes stop_codon:yes gene_type:complete
MDSWTVCIDCKGLGKKRRRLKKKVRQRYQLSLDLYKKTNGKGTTPIRPKGELYPCPICTGSGIIPSKNPPIPDEVNYPKIAIIGGGIGGVAFAVACLHRGIPFTLYERDESFETRSQGYGLTLQQASNAIKGFGISALKKGVVSTKHVVHTTEGEVIGEWGMRKWSSDNSDTPPKRTNIHIARQSLRLALLEQLKSREVVQWGHQLVSLKETKGEGYELTFKVNEELKNARADLIVGADGIRSSVRKIMIGEKKSPLQYLDCIVILGICSLSSLKGVKSDLLDSATVFQTANGNERIYVMPYDAESVMWQLSFPMTEGQAKELSNRGAQALKDEAFKRTQWHSPIPEIISATKASKVSGYPVYDRELLNKDLLKKFGAVTLIGDAAHPMSPFKGQGANQALLDALSLAREITIECRPKSNWRERGLRKSVLDGFETEMQGRSASKVKDSAMAAKFLHSEIVLHKGNEPRGRVLKRKTGKA